VTQTLRDVRHVATRLALACLAAAVVPAVAHAVPLPSTPAGERLIEFFAVIAAHDGPRAREFIAGSVARAWQERASKSGLLQYLEAITDSCGSFAAVSIDSSAEHSIVVTARIARGVRLRRVELGTEEVAPFRITHVEVGVMPLEQEPHALQAPTPPGAPEIHAIVDSLASALRAYYVDADTGRAIAEHLLAREHDGAYDTVTSLADLATRLMADMRAAHPDKHLWVLTEGGPAPGGPESANGPPPDFGFADARVLVGNVGYLKVTRMVIPTPEAQAALVVAMAKLMAVRTMIVDVRGNWGGAGGMNAYLWGYFTGPDSVATLEVWSRAMGKVMQNWTRPATSPGPRRDVRLFVLTDSVTVSAAEAFAFWLQQSGRAKIVGGRTAGGGHNVRRVPIAPGVDALISVTRVSYPGTQREWEGVGVEPDVPAPAAQALDVAVRLARPKHQY